MAISPKGSGSRLGGGKLPAKAYTEYTRPSRTSENFSPDVRSDAKLRRAPINVSILFGKKEDEDDEMYDIRKAAIKRKLSRSRKRGKK